MRVRKGYMPGSFAERYGWCDNFLQKLLTMKDRLNITPEQWNRLETGTAALGKANEYIDRCRALSQAWTKYRNNLWQSDEVATVAMPFDASLAQQGGDMPADFEDFVRGLVRYIQGQPAYTEADGRALGFFGSVVTVDIENAKPAARLSASGGRVRIRYGKLNTFTGVQVRVDHGTGKFETLGSFTRTTIDDPTPLPPEPTRWIYRLRYLIGDTLAGQPSEAFEIVVSDGD